MGFHTKRQFADLINDQTKNLSQYIKRGKVIVEENGLINDMNATNISFLLTRKGKKQPIKQQIPREETYVASAPFKIGPANDDEDSEMELDKNGIPEVSVSDKIYKHWLAKKTESAAEIDRIKIDKMKGMVIPSELIKPLFQQHNQSILAEFKNMMDEQLRFIAKQYDLNIVQVSEIKGKWVEGLNSAICRAKTVTIKGIDNIINNYSEK